VSSVCVCVGMSDDDEGTQGKKKEDKIIRREHYMNIEQISFIFCLLMGSSIIKKQQGT
jgi:hypothetical protein